MTRIEVVAVPWHRVRSGVKVYASYEGSEGIERLAPAADRALQQLVKGSGHRGALNETVLLPHDGGWVIVAGLGKAKDASIERLRQCAATAARVARARGFTEMALPLSLGERVGSPADVAQAMAEGALLGLYRYAKLKRLSPLEQRKRMDRVVLVTDRRAARIAEARCAAEQGRVIAEAVMLARDLITGPSNVVTPTALAGEARRLAQRVRLKCTVIPLARLKRMGFGGIVGVAQGSAHPAQLIIVDYAPARARATFALCGKGITFDAGGISIKPAAKMERMKYDMSGAAAVLGAVQAAAALRLPHRVIGIIAAAENLPSGTAQKPGDVLRTLSGKTVEVINTDAEGRLVLADCLHYAKRFKPDCVVDVATLTGACVVALGTQAIGLMTADDRLAQRLTEAGEATHERVWRLPMWEEYGRQLKSEIADLKNVSDTGQAGTIMGAKFLEAFAEGLRWAHLDIAGTAWSDESRPYVPKGAVGVGVRLLVKLMERWA